MANMTNTTDYKFKSGDVVSRTKDLEKLNKVTIKITEKKTLVKEVSLTVPKEWGIHGTEDGGGTFAIAIREYTPRRMEALAEALKKLGVIGCQETTIFVLSPKWEIDHTAHTGEGTLTLKKYKHEYEYYEN